MQDLFGTEVEEERPVLSDAELDNLVENIFFEGELIAQVGVNLQKLKTQKSTEKISPARKVAWEDFLWIYDLGMPAALSFDKACEASNADAENIRCMISREFCDEIRIMCEVLTTRIPECGEEISRKLGRYIKLK